MQKEKELKLKIEPKDTDVVPKFFEHFKIQMPDYLVASIDAFKANPSVPTQEDLKLALTKSIKEMQTEIEALDEIFKPVVEACSDVAFEMQFDKDFEETIGVETDGATPQVPQESSESQVAAESQESSEPQAE